MNLSWKTVLVVSMLFIPPAVADEPLQLALGNQHSCILFETGKVKCWGKNDHGQLGLGDNAHRGDQAGEMGDNLPFVQLPTSESVQQLALGSDFTCALTATGKVYCFGRNRYGQLGLGDTESRGTLLEHMGAGLQAADLGSGMYPISAIAAGERHVCALGANRLKIKCWGSNQYGQLGLEDRLDRGSATGQMGDALPAVQFNARAIAQVDAGGQHTCVRFDSGELKCWGANRFGQLGVGDTVQRGDEAGEMSQLPDIPYAEGDAVSQMTTGFVQTCIQTASDKIKCWGFNGDGRLGTGDRLHRGMTSETKPALINALDLGEALPIKEFSCRYRHCCAVFLNNAAKCWGVNRSGGLGLEDNRLRGQATVEMGHGLPFVDLGDLVEVHSMAVGEAHSCAILRDDRIKCWGDNAHGQLGLGDRLNRGDRVGTMGDHLPFVPY